MRGWFTPAAEARRNWVIEAIGEQRLTLTQQALVAAGATASDAERGAVEIAWLTVVYGAAHDGRSPSRDARQSLAAMSQALIDFLERSRQLDWRVALRFSEYLKSADPIAWEAWSALEHDAAAVQSRLLSFTSTFRGQKPKDTHARDLIGKAAQVWKDATGQWPLVARDQTMPTKPPVAPLYSLIRDLVKEASRELPPEASSVLMTALTPNRFVEAVKAAKAPAENLPENDAK